MDSHRQSKINTNKINMSDIRDIEKQVKEKELELQDIYNKISIAGKITEKIKDRNLLKELFQTRDNIKLSIYYREKMIKSIKSKLLIS